MSKVAAYTVTVTTFALEARELGGPSGKAVVCPDVRYASAQWRGSDRPTRLHLSPADWKAVTVDLELLIADIWVNDQSGLARLVTEGRSDLRCTGVTTLEAEPWAMSAALDELLMGK